MGVDAHVSNAWPFCGDYDNAYVTIQQDGSVHLASGVPDMGTGTSTTLPQLTAEVVGVSLDRVSMTLADTASTPFDIGSHASRALYAAGTAVVEAARDARRQVLEYAADLFKVHRKDLFWRIQLYSRRAKLPAMTVQAARYVQLAGKKGKASP